MTRLEKLTRLTIPLTLVLGFLPELEWQIESYLLPNLEYLTITDDLGLFWAFGWEPRDIVNALAP